MKKNQFPEMTPTFDQRVRQTLQNLPEQQRQTRRNPFKLMITVGIAAALSIGGTAFAASGIPEQIGQHFKLFFQPSQEKLVDDYAVTPEPGTLLAENEKYSVEIDSVLFDSSAKTGIISLHMHNKKEDGVMPFSLSRILPEFQGAGLLYSNFAECYGSNDGEYAFEVLYDSTTPEFGEDGFSGSKFYLDEARSTENDYYIEGAFIPGRDYAPDGALRLELLEIGKFYLDNHGVQRLASALTVTLPQPKAMPSLSSADGNVTLSQIGLYVRMENCCVVDDLDIAIVKLKDGTEIVLLDEENGINNSLYAYGYSFDENTGDEEAEYGPVSDIGIYVLGKPFVLENVSAISLNGTEYPLS